MSDRLRLQKTSHPWTKKPVALTRDPSITVGAKAMYDAVSTHANTSGEDAFPSMNTLAGYLGVERRTARRYVTELVKTGWLLRESRGGESGQTSNLYTIIFEKDTPRTPVSYPPDSDDLGAPDTGVLPRSRSPLEQEKDSGADAPPSRKPKAELDELFETLAFGSFGLSDMSLVGKVGGRIGKLRKWLTAEFPDHGPDDLRLFYAWYAEEYPGVDAPRDLDKFSEHYVRFASGARLQTGTSLFIGQTVV